MRTWRSRRPNRYAGTFAAALSARGFEEELRGDDSPPIARYWLGERSGFFAEFLAPLHGSGLRRDGTADATVRKAGVTAQKLRYIDLLLVQPFAVRLGASLGIPLEPPADVLLANPVSFIAQKLLIHKERGSQKKSQDMLYIHDTLELFAAHLENLREIWCEDVRPALPAKTAQTVERLATERFAEVNDVIRSAARIPQDRTLRPQQVRAACAHGLKAIFGEGGA